MKVEVNSEIGKLEGVIIHRPGKEIENMVPQNAQRALYSDILNLSIASNEYSQFESILKQYSNVFYVNELLKNCLENNDVREELLMEICKREDADDSYMYLQSLSAHELTEILICGKPIYKNTLSKYLSSERYSLSPLPNFFFTRDASATVGNQVLINKMANNIREREALIMDTIFRNEDLFQCEIVPVHKTNRKGFSIEGGDIIVASEDTLLVGLGKRTSSSGIDYLIEHYKYSGKIKHILVQELPETPESFIHLDMVFTILDKDKCMVYEPLLLMPNRYRSIHIELSNGKVKITEEDSLLNGLKKLNMDLKPVICGGSDDAWFQEREQWHSGTNFFALEPGKIIGYERNIHTIEALSKAGFEIVNAEDINNGEKLISDYDKLVITIDGDELARGGGGARCMTMPVKRANWQ